MTKLLVSVRDADEAALAHTGGADLIDVKEPALGSLGAASPLAWEEIKEFVRTLNHGKGSQSLTPDLPIPPTQKICLSLALGELHEPAIASRAKIAHGVDYAKIGLAGCAASGDWEKHWESTLTLLPQEVEPVAVIYADQETACAPIPERVIQVAASLGCAAVLFDTYEKSQGDLFAHLHPNRLAELIAECQTKSMLVVLGGSLRDSGIHRALMLAPDYVAVRGAVCRESRSGAIDVNLVRLVAHQVREFPSSTLATEICRQA